MRWFPLCLSAVLMVGGAAQAQERKPAFSADELISILTPPPVTRAVRPTVGAPGTPGSGVVPNLQILFPFNSAELTPEAKAQLDLLAQALQSPQLQQLRFRIAGHTDAVGSDDYNQSLSARRARAAVRYLEQTHGIDRLRLEAFGLGEKELADTGNPASEANRRVEVKTLR